MSPVNAANPAFTLGRIHALTRMGLGKDESGLKMTPKQALEKIEQVLDEYDVALDGITGEVEE